MTVSFATELHFLQMTYGVPEMALGLITDEDLRYALPGNPTLGAVFRELGEVQQSYIDSFKTLKQEWTYEHADKDVETSKEKLGAWFKHLNDAMNAAVVAFDNATLDEKKLDRGGDFMATPREQMQMFGDAVFIFTGKVSAYLRALGKATDQWKSYFG
jgi:uncharacterized damage-inducible protein DinB